MQLEKIVEYILNCKSQILELNNYLIQLNDKFVLAKDIASGKSYCDSIWADNPIIVTVIPSKTKV
jgi:hypothetical protein